MQKQFAKQKTHDIKNDLRDYLKSTQFLDVMRFLLGAIKFSENLLGQNGQLKSVHVS